MCEHAARTVKRKPIVVRVTGEEDINRALRRIIMAQGELNIGDLGGSAGKSVRLFMAPGMLHCGGGEGPSSFDVLDVIDQWVEKGQAPDRVIASRRKDGKVDRSRPLCPYPQVAKYKGTGSTDDAANFVCTEK